MTESEQERITLTVKYVPAEIWQRAKECAARRDQIMGDWLARAMLRQIEIESRDGLVAPELFEPAPAPARPPEAGAPQLVGLSELREAMEAAQAVALASGLDIPKTTARHAYALLTATLRAARGLPPLARRKSAARIEGPVQTAPGR